MGILRVREIVECVPITRVPGTHFGQILNREDAAILTRSLAQFES